MKLFISADLEGIAGVTHWNETNITHPEYGNARELMTESVIAACQGAIEAGVKEIVIKDAHATGRNIISENLPGQVKLVRGWSGHPFSMMQELDKTFDAALMIGYHSRAGADSHPLAHTITGKVSHIKINGCFVSEFIINTFTAAYVNVPVIFVSGDKALCDDVKLFNPYIETTPVCEGVGDSTISIPPKQATTKIKEGVVKALSTDLSACKIELPEFFEVEIKYSDPVTAYKTSFYPGIRSIEPRVLAFESKDYFDVLRMMHFAI